MVAGKELRRMVQTAGFQETLRRLAEYVIRRGT
jgi:hypothetical protein